MIFTVVASVFYYLLVVIFCLRQVDVYNLYGPCQWCMTILNLCVILNLISHVS